MEGKRAALLLGALGLVGCGPAVGLDSSGNDEGTSGGVDTSTAGPPLETTSGDPTAPTASDTGNMPETGSSSTGTAPVGPDEVLEGCEGDRYRAGRDTDTPVHVISVRQPGLAEFDVEWSLPGDGILVLSSYDPVHWRITLAGEGSLSRIVANGFEVFTVDGPEGVEVELLPEPDYRLWASRYPAISGERMRARVEHLLSLPVTGMDMCDGDATAAVITPHNALGEPEPPPATGCERAFGGRELCVYSSYSSGRFSVLDPSTGDRCHVNEQDGYFDDPHRGWGVKDPLTAYVCTNSPYIDSTSVVTEVDLISGLARWTAVPCSRVYTSSWGLVVVYADNQVRLFDDVFSGTPAAEYTIGSIDTLAADAETLYQLSGDNIVQRWELYSGDPIDSFQLPTDANLDWFTVTDGRLLAREAPVLHVFDAETGEFLESVDISTSWPGELSCIDRPKI